MACNKNKLLSQQVKPKNRGFTLIEIILSIVVLAISLSIISTLIAPTEEQSADAILQIKAAELAQSLMNDINSRAYDNRSDMAGGRHRCGEVDQPACSIALGPDNGVDGRDNDGEDPNDVNTFDDVDDFDGFTLKVNAINAGLDSGYTSFDLNVSVEYAGGDLGLAAINAKKITVVVTTPLGTDIEFASHKANF
ncbi:prepilin-type N-terminal cleavage/methylation domain-containing protein [Litorilituus lipolyticus]|uniref:Type II secretion system protein n=1 Tax=Litorilituus lipolyticus TaxID=2491017 RepID=A0A502L1L0_9GAMM|nr:prepilin-type N-terminal cleavage/methylation domain-containing protein [Litorilituus lipolyticus]TPH17798.1 type II secretion system protein [Litorilituus lipolyticus]